MPTVYALQTTVRDIAVHDKTFVQFHTLQEVFPLKSVCFMLGHPHYGAMGEASCVCWILILFNLSDYHVDSD